MVILLFFSLAVRFQFAAGETFTSIVGDPGMKRDGLRVAFEGWNFCNEVGQEAPAMGSPRAADCFDLSGSSLTHRVTEEENKLGLGKSFPGLSDAAMENPDLYAAEKEVYLGSLCEVKENEFPAPWQFWMVMLKNGNYDVSSKLCPENGRKVGNNKIPPAGRFPCFGPGCMNQPLLDHRQTSLSGDLMRGGFSGTYDLSGRNNSNSSFFEVAWEKQIGKGGWTFRHKLKISRKYPWLMLYLRADATRGFSGGYHYDTRGILTAVPESPNFTVRLRLDVIRGGGSRSQFYLLDLGGCWKNSGEECDGDVITDVTRYTEMIINPEIQSWCNPSSLENCPPYHTDPSGRKIHRSEAESFPYSAYHVYCAPRNAEHLEERTNRCDPYSNPQSQEIVQILPHPTWKPHGYPSKAGEGWIGNPRAWELDAGELSSRLYFYQVSLRFRASMELKVNPNLEDAVQDPGTRPARRRWSSVDVGTEIYIGAGDESAEWTLSEFDVFVKNSSGSP